MVVVVVLHAPRDVPCSPLCVPSLERAGTLCALPPPRHDAALLPGQKQAIFRGAANCPCCLKFNMCARVFFANW